MRALKMNLAANNKNALSTENAQHFVVSFLRFLTKKLLETLILHFASQCNLNINSPKIKVITRNLRHVTLKTYFDAQVIIARDRSDTYHYRR